LTDEFYKIFWPFAVAADSILGSSSSTEGIVKDLE